MSKLSCDVIKDLLPLYKDDICSEKSKDLIEEHLRECDNCREYLEAMDDKLPPISLASDIAGSQTDNASDPAAMGALAGDIEFLEKIARRLNWMKITICLFATIIILIILSVIRALFPLPFDRRIATEDVRITELYQLENGDLYFTLESDIPFQIPQYTQIVPPNGLAYTESYDNGQSYVTLSKCSFLERTLLERPSFHRCSFVTPLKETVDDAESGGDDEDISSEAIVHENSHVYYEGRQDEQLTIWKKGQKIDAAPKKVEERVLRERNIQEYGYDYSKDDEEVSEEDVIFLLR